MTRFDILDTAGEIVGGHRVTDYGEPEDNFGVIARLWSAYLGIDISDVDVSMLMVLFKAGRIKSGTATEDSFVDICGYAACGGEIAERDRKDNDTVPKSVIPAADIPIIDRGIFDDVLDTMNELISKYGYASVADIYAVEGMPGIPSTTPYSLAHYTTQYVWTSTHGVELHTIEGTYHIHLPAAVEYGSGKRKN
jgi:hypothetical protein